MATDLQSLDRNDQVILGAGVAAFIASFFPYWGVSVSGGILGHASSSVTAWHSYATLGLLFVLAATAVAAMLIFNRAALPESPMSWNFVVLGLSAIGTALLIIRSFTLQSGHIGGFSYGLKWGAYVLMIICVVQSVFAFLRFRASGEAFPWEGTGSASS